MDELLFVSAKANGSRRRGRGEVALALSYSCQCVSLTCAVLLRLQNRSRHDQETETTLVAEYLKSVPVSKQPQAAVFLSRQSVSGMGGNTQVGGSLLWRLSPTFPVNRKGTAPPVP